jgi:hypothetical protein
MTSQDTVETHQPCSSSMNESQQSQGPSEPAIEVDHTQEGDDTFEPTEGTTEPAVPV